MSGKKALLVILDGWGLGTVPESDAIAQANTPNFDRYWREHPHATLVTFGEAVGLPEGQMGNSEVGHLNIGAGRVVFQSLARINKSIREGELEQNETLQAALAYAKANEKALHLMGLVSDGGVHSHIDHLLYLCDVAVAAGPEKIYIHAFTDGRDVDPRSGVNFLQRVLEHTAAQPTQLATITGRYYAMDRDNRWERIKLAYDALVRGKGEKTRDALATVREHYANGTTDEFLPPIICTDERGEPVAKIETGDVVLSFNFRTDRPRQITRVLTQEDRPEHDIHRLDLRYLTMTNYDETFEGMEVLFSKEDLSNVMGQVLERAGKTQVRIAETEKYAHVTFFFSGGREAEFVGERRLLIPSPQEVATYDEKPEMSAYGVTDAIVADIEKNTPDFICLNYANTDMVGHTGVFSAAVRAAEAVDECLGRLIETARRHDYECLIIADHGNSDFMRNADGSPNTAHTTNLVPCIYVGSREEVLHSGKLGDVAPTLLHLMEVPTPPQMKGEVLLTTAKQ